LREIYREKDPGQKRRAITGGGLGCCAARAARVVIASGMRERRRHPYTLAAAFILIALAAVSFTEQGQRDLAAGQALLRSVLHETPGPTRTTIPATSRTKDPITERK
jgi:hypothetical protein